MQRLEKLNKDLSCKRWKRLHNVKQTFESWKHTFMTPGFKGKREV